MRFPGFIGPSYTLQSKNVDAQRCINYYPEMDELGTGKEREVMSLVGTPGLKLLASLGVGPVRGTYTTSTGALYVVSGTGLYSVDSTWTATLLGSLLTSIGPVSMADNGLQMVCVDGPNGYYVTLSTSVFTQITDPNFLGANQVTFQDGYFIFNKPGTQQFYISGLNAITFDPTDIATKEGSPDNIVGLISDHLNLYLFGSISSEVFYDSGNTFPFERVQGAFLPIGCLSTFSIAKFQGSIFWLGCDEQGRGIVYRSTAYQPARISNFALENVIAGVSASNISTARAWTYQQRGHSFYCLNIPGTESTWVFDTATSLWHERSYLNLGDLVRHRADCHAYAYSTNVVGDYLNGNLYALDPATYSDNGNPLPRVRSAPHLTNSLDRLFHHWFQLDMEVGVGADGNGQGVSPQAMLQWSDDGGHTWSSERWTSIGPIGKTKTRAIWRRLGHSRDRVYRAWITDPVKVTLIGADIGFDAGVA